MRRRRRGRAGRTAAALAAVFALACSPSDEPPPDAASPPVARVPEPADTAVPPAAPADDPLATSRLSPMLRLALDGAGADTAVHTILIQLARALSREELEALGGQGMTVLSVLGDVATAGATRPAIVRLLASEDVVHIDLSMPLEPHRGGSGL